MKKLMTILAVLVLGSFFVVQTATAAPMYYYTTDLDAGGYSSTYSFEIVDNMSDSVTDVSFGMAYDFNQDGDVADAGEKYQIFNTDFSTTLDTGTVYFKDFGGAQYVSDGSLSFDSSAGWALFDSSHCS